MSETQLTADEVFDSLTGFDEIAISQHFGRTVAELAGTDQSMIRRALVFVVKRREGINDDDARHAALEMKMKDSLGFFAEPSEDEAGKDERPEPSPESSPSGVTSPDEAEMSLSL